VTRTEGPWQKIRRDDGKVGWIESKKIEEI